MKLKFVIVVISLLSLIACTENQRSRKFGGNQTIQLEHGTKLVNVTWKNKDLWILTRKAKAGETPEIHEFIEKSEFGILEGKIIFTENF